MPLLQQTSSGEPLRFHVDDAAINSKQCVALALMTNELVSNARKHGKGEVEVTFTVVGGRAHLEVCDDGPGFPHGFDPDVAANTGIELVIGLGRADLAGALDFENRVEGGARVCVTFPLGIAAESMGQSLWPPPR